MKDLKPQYHNIVMIKEFFEVYDGIQNTGLPFFTFFVLVI